MTVKNRAFVLRECRASHSERDVQSISECVGDRADVPARSGIERRAILEKKLLATRSTQPLQRFKRLSNGLFGTDGAAFQGNNDSINILWQGPFRYTDHLQRSHPATYQSTGQISTAGKVVSDATE
ncbi:hypothetical protein D9M69_628120 [compost metagenome]